MREGGRQVPLLHPLTPRLRCLQGRDRPREGSAGEKKVRRSSVATYGFLARNQRSTSAATAAAAAVAAEADEDEDAYDLAGLKPEPAATFRKMSGTGSRDSSRDGGGTGVSAPAGSPVKAGWGTLRKTFMSDSRASSRDGGAANGVS